MSGQPGAGGTATTDTRDCFQRYDEGFSRILALELAGQPVPEAWVTRLAALYQDCVAAETAAKAGRGQAALFGPETGRRYT